MAATKTVDLEIAHVFGGKTFPAGAGVEVPAAMVVKDKEGKPVKAAAAGRALPEDFPRRQELVDGGVSTAEAVAALSDEQLIALKGIGEKSVPEIRAATDSLLKKA